MSWNVTIDDQKVKESEEGFKPLAPGWYECFITGVDVNKEAQSGSKGVEVVFVVRDDVGQEGKGRKVWENFWVLKPDGTESGAKPRLDKLMRTLGYTEAGYTPETVKQVLLGASIKVEFEQNTYEDNNGNKKTNNRATFMGFEPSVKGGSAPADKLAGASSTAAGTTDPFAQDGKPIDIKDDDLPF